MISIGSRAFAPAGCLSFCSFLLAEAAQGSGDYVMPSHLPMHFTHFPSAISSPIIQSILPLFQYKYRNSNDSSFQSISFVYPKALHRGWPPFATFKLPSTSCSQRSISVCSAKIVGLVRSLCDRSSLSFALLTPRLNLCSVLEPSFW
uniref:Putative secreted protein n=1 Tax=Anopheles triannulatus TaxID=58253 RepID=A0A2M4B1Z8_9DIPT